MNISSFEGKKILFISVRTFNYEVEIADKLKGLGAYVDYFDERPSNSILTKILIRLKRSIIQKKIDNYYNNILEKIRNEKYDFFFLIKGETVPSFFLVELRQLQKNCLFIFYTWDSFENNPNSLSILHFFDKKLTFDYSDSQKFKLEFRPLFYIDKYKELKNNCKPKHKVLFLGTAHSDRYTISNAVVNWCKKHKYSTFTHYYIQSKLVYFLKSKFVSSFKKIPHESLKFKPLSIDEVIKYYEDSSIILDINHPNQRGLTMRTFEALGAGRKLITTNKEIKKYLFYNQNNILVIDREDIRLNKNFFAFHFKPMNGDVLFAMSITGWIEAIFIQNDSNYWLNKKNKL